MNEWIKFQILKFKCVWHAAQIAYYNARNERLRKEKEELIRKLNHKNE